MGNEEYGESKHEIQKEIDEGLHPYLPALQPFMDFVPDNRAERIHRANFGSKEQIPM